MEAPKTIWDIHRLTGRLAALRRFISRSVEKSLPFVEVLKGAKNFEWGPDCVKAFEEVKEYPMKAPLLMSPDLKETSFVLSREQSDFGGSSSQRK